MKQISFLPFISEDSEILILGSFPSVKPLEQYQYYGNKQNQFWKLIFEVFRIPFELDYSKRLEVLKDNKIALWDVFETCEREGSLDSQIKNPEVNDFEKLFQSFKNLKIIVFSSKNAFKFYNKYVGDFFEKEYLIMPSTSGLYAAMKYEEKLKQWSRLKNE